MGLAVSGSGIAACRWLNGTIEVEELLFQVPSGAIYERTFTNSSWLPGSHTVKDSLDNVPVGASLSAATVDSSNGSMIILSYVSKGALVTIQTRETRDSSDDTYSTAKHLRQDSVQSRTGLAVVNSSGEANIYITIDKKIVKLSSNNATASNWTITDI
jgi:hypothetical protein